MKSELVLTVGIICLAILGVFISYTQPEESKLLYVIVAIIAAVMGVGGTVAIPKIAAKIRKWRYG